MSLSFQVKRRRAVLFPTPRLFFHPGFPLINLRRVFHILDLHGITFNYKVCNGDPVWLFSRRPVSCPRTSTANTPSDFSHLCRARNDCVFLGLLLDRLFQSISRLVFLCQSLPVALEYCLLSGRLVSAHTLFSLRIYQWSFLEICLLFRSSFNLHTDIFRWRVLVLNSVDTFFSAPNLPQGTLYSLRHSAFCGGVLLDAAGSFLPHCHWLAWAPVLWGGLYIELLGSFMK